MDDINIIREVATKVMGWALNDYDVTPCVQILGKRLFKEWNEHRDMREWNPVISWNHAREVIEHLGELALEVTRVQDGDYRVAFYNRGVNSIFIAKDAEFGRAVCLAALQVAGVEVEQPTT